MSARTFSLNYEYSPVIQPISMPYPWYRNRIYTFFNTHLVAIWILEKPVTPYYESVSVYCHHIERSTQTSELKANELQ